MLTYALFSGAVAHAGPIQRDTVPLPPDDAATAAVSAVYEELVKATTIYGDVGVDDITLRTLDQEFGGQRLVLASSTWDGGQRFHDPAWLVVGEGAPKVLRVRPWRAHLLFLGCTPVGMAAISKNKDAEALAGIEREHCKTVTSSLHEPILAESGEEQKAALRDLVLLVAMLNDRAATVTLPSREAEIPGDIMVTEPLVFRPFSVGPGEAAETVMASGMWMRTVPSTARALKAFELTVDNRGLALKERKIGFWPATIE